MNIKPMGYGIRMEAYTQMIRGLFNPQKEETSNPFKEFVKDIFRNGYVAGTVNGLNWEMAFESFYKIMINDISEKENKNMNIKTGDTVVLKDWEELNHDGASWYGISKETYNELKMRVRVIEEVNVSYTIEDNYGIPFYITDEAIKKVLE